ncbi:class I SAM-dependent methyltransferase [Streptomyces milbemycinicus]|uniref:class I SAM-dependent methyltransferase n=1 Tax=Streptomyces milbemycinicus TaxID=476552 RepID=UPI0033E0DF1C
MSARVPPPRVPAPRVPAPPGRPIGSATRGTTNPNRLRRMDRWIAAAHAPALRRAEAPIAVDLGYGAAPWTAVELLGRLRTVRPDARVVGVEIDPDRVAAARPYRREGLDFAHGGFEVPLPDGARPALIRAANVLRQYDEDEVADVWRRLCARLAPGGLLVEGTCDEIGRRHVWVALTAHGPRTVTFAARLGSLDRPSDLAERLPKALIHRNVPGEPVHTFLRDFDRAWAAAAPYAALSARQRWIRSAEALRAAGWPLVDGPRRWRQGELTVSWEALAPRP